MSVYSDKFILRMVDLNCINLATSEDKKCRLDQWARMFKAATWEEIKMIAKQDTDLLEASETLYMLNADYIVRKQCEARDDYYRLHNTIRKEFNELLSENQVLHSEKRILHSQLDNLNSQLDNLNTQIQEKDLLIAQLKSQLSEDR